MPEWINDVLVAIQPYWPAIVKLVTFWYLGQVMKKRVFTKARAAAGDGWKLARDTMPGHPLVAGVGIGLLYPWLPAVEFVTTRGGAVLEGVLVGVLSVVGFMGLEYAAEQFGWGWVLRTLRDTGRPTSVPPPPETKA